MPFNWIGFLGGLVALAALLFGMFKWFVGWAEKKHLEHEERWERHDLEIEKLRDENRRQEIDIRETDKRMQSDFVRNDAFTRLQENIRLDFNKLDSRIDRATEVMGGIHERISGIARDLNRLIGAHQNGKDS